MGANSPLSLNQSRNARSMCLQEVGNFLKNVSSPKLQLSQNMEGIDAKEDGIYKSNTHSPML